LEPRVNRRYRQNKKNYQIVAVLQVIGCGKELIRMGIKFGEIDATQILENEYRIGILEHIVNVMMQRAPTAAPTREEMANITAAVIRRMQEKYPNSGIGLTPNTMAGNG
jgi:hypothetical protein